MSSASERARHERARDCCEVERSADPCSCTPTDSRRQRFASRTKRGRPRLPTPRCLLEFERAGTDSEVAATTGLVNEAAVAMSNIDVETQLRFILKHRNRFRCSRLTVTRHHVFLTLVCSSPAFSARAGVDPLRLTHDCSRPFQVTSKGKYSQTPIQPAFSILYTTLPKLATSSPPSSSLLPPPPSPSTSAISLGPPHSASEISLRPLSHQVPPDPPPPLLDDHDNNMFAPVTLARAASQASVKRLSSYRREGGLATSTPSKLDQETHGAFPFPNVGATSGHETDSDGEDTDALEGHFGQASEEVEDPRAPLLERRGRSTTRPGGLHRRETSTYEIAFKGIAQEEGDGRAEVVGWQGLVARGVFFVLGACILLAWNSEVRRARLARGR